jgi:radical SAM superfamily enzyme YgiQ (UPF0313 family)
VLTPQIAGQQHTSVDDSDAALDRWPALGPEPRVLMVWPRFPLSFWGFEGMMRILPEKAVTPPLGLITVAALCPPRWRIRLIDCSIETLRDEDILSADLVMLSAMHAQRADMRAVLACCRRLGRRSMIGGPYASSEPEALLPLADHVVVGEVDECFGEIAADLETGRARRLYRIDQKPDLTHSPVPRFDLLHLDGYASMSVQFSRGCPFQCEFCDIITIYGRKPRTKTADQLLGELNVLRELGWRRHLFIVDDNFIGNRRSALELARRLAVWQRRHGYPFVLYTETSIDLAAQQELMDAMVDANFLYVFIGIETPSEASLRETRKFQNLRMDSLEQIRIIQRSGLWVTGGFIVGFDSDTADIFDQQTAFIERAAIPWAMTGILQAPPTTALHERMARDGRLLDDIEPTTNFSPPNFRTALPVDVLLRGLRRMLLDLYEPDRFFRRAFRSLECWQPRPTQHASRLSWLYWSRALVASVWHQGILSDYRLAYWRFLTRAMFTWWTDPVRLWKTDVLLVSAHHFLNYARSTADELEQQALAALRDRSSDAS